MTTNDPIAATHQRAARDERVVGLCYGLGAYTWWGSVVPLYLKLLRDAPALELLAQRVVFGLPVLLLLLASRNGMPELRRVLRDKRARLVLLASAVLLATNWFAFIYSVVNARLMDSSLGYYINPLVSVALGMIFLGERQRTTQWVAIILAAAAVTIMTIQRGELPWISVTVALTFGTYGLVRKTVRAGATVGLTIELLAMLPFAIGLYAWLIISGKAMLVSTGDQAASLGTAALMVLGGAVVIAPLVWFSAAARRLRLSTMGLLQYLAPTGQFLIAVFSGEPLHPYRLAAFVLIWIALFLFSFDSIRARFRAERPA
ncbi:MAG: EamA family transporter RarD [Phycisphaerales bacterium]|jgi:chloramphenicol-sensitive protein RarD|nr:EamA family transporter RarD [Phycisphaerales bacterium]